MTNPVKKVADTYKRWRHTRGYGVHSPYGYRTVIRVLRPAKGYGYYGEVDLIHRCGSTSERRRIKDARRLLRLAAELDITSCYLPPDSAACFHNALMGARSDMRMISAVPEATNCQLVCTAGAFVPLNTLCEIARQPTVRAIVLHRPPKAWSEEVFSFINEGIMFVGRRNTLIIRHEGMQKVIYTVSI